MILIRSPVLPDNVYLEETKAVNASLDLKSVLVVGIIRPRQSDIEASHGSSHKIRWCPGCGERCSCRGGSRCWRGTSTIAALKLVRVAVRRSILNAVYCG